MAKRLTDEQIQQNMETVWKLVTKLPEMRQTLVTGISAFSGRAGLCGTNACPVSGSASVVLI